MSHAKKIESWTHYIFEGTTYVENDFKKFCRDMKSYLKNIMEAEEGFLASFTQGHYYFSAFLQRKDGKIFYISSRDVRGYQPGASALHNLLIRTAKHTKDFTGGANHYTSFDEIKNTMDILSNR